MNAFLKGTLHSVASALALFLPVVITHNQIFDTSIGAILILSVNWIISHTIPTTTGASANQ